MIPGDFMLSEAERLARLHPVCAGRDVRVGRWYGCMTCVSADFSELGEQMRWGIGLADTDVRRMDGPWQLAQVCIEAVGMTANKITGRPAMDGAEEWRAEPEWPK